MMEEGIEHFQVLSLDLPCQHCKALQLDDAAQGGIVRHKRNGERFVDFGEVEETYAERPGAGIAGRATRAGAGKHDDTIETWPRLQLKLGYKREDTFPGLPSLGSTGSMGCAFCKILRGDVLSVWDKIEGDSRGVIGSDHSEGAVHQAKLIITEIAYQLYESNDTDDVEVSGGRSQKISLDSLYVFFTINWGSKSNDYSLHYNISADATDPCASWFQIWRRPLPNNHLSPPSIKHLDALIAKSLLEVPATNTYYPTRLLDIGLGTRTELRLVIPATDSTFIRGERYAALSYCWGPKKEAENQLKTTSATIQDHTIQIDFGRLPQTVADAVQVCRGLRVRYLWVDALCIIQDDSNDWATEAFNMSKVYANSFVTLCIVQGDSCASGFLKRPYSPCMLRTNFRSSLDSSVSGKLYLRMLQPPEKGFKGPKRDMDTLIDGSPDNPADLDVTWSAWKERGWTFQEAWMSPRKIFFGPSMFHFSCGNLKESADGSKFDDDELFPGAERKLEKVLDHWYSLVKQYGNRLLSYEKDRFPALSALSRTIVDMFPDQEYLAGLWKSDLHRGLLWTPYSWSDLPTYLGRPEGYIAPSWSWAHCPRGLNWVQGVGTSLYSISPEFELKEANIITEAANPYGRVSSGSLELDAKLFRPPLDKGEGSVIETPDSETRWLGLIFHYTLLSEGGEYIASFHLDWITLGRKKQPEDPLPFDRLWMILISRSSLNNVLDNPRPSKDELVTNPEIMLGLLLLPTGNENEFVKVGLWYSETRGLGGSKFWNDIRRQSVTLV